MADVHRLGDIRRRVVNNISPRFSGGRDTQMRVRKRGLQSSLEPVIRQPEIDEPRPGNFRRLTKASQFQLAGQLSRQFPTVPLQLARQRHAEIGLIVAELGVLSGANLPQIFSRIDLQLLQQRSESSADFFKWIHANLK